MKVGDKAQIKVYKADGTLFRCWPVVVESIGHDPIVVAHPAGVTIEQAGGGWTTQYSIRAFCWRGRPYILLEVYQPDGELVELYAHVSSRPVIEDSVVQFTDYELDVVLQPGQAAQIVDEDEFAQAVIDYGYSPEFQAACYQAAHEAMELLKGWVPGGLPRFERANLESVTVWDGKERQCD
jgi:protein associated with RNAse G/E